MRHMSLDEGHNLFAGNRAADVYAFPAILRNPEVPQDFRNLRFVVVFHPHELLAELLEPCLPMVEEKAVANALPDPVRCIHFRDLFTVARLHQGSD